LTKVDILCKLVRMSTIYPRRSERVAMKRNVQLVFRNARGRVDRVSASTYAVNCHGAGLYAQHDYPLGSEVFLVDHGSGVGVWGKLVWEGPQLRDGRVPVGVEFTHPDNYWNSKLVPRSWVPFACQTTKKRPYVHPSSDRVVLVGSDSVYPLPPRKLPLGELCRCCGGMDEVAVAVATGSEPLCDICRQWPA
jgi:hypothetical protein